MVNDSPYPDISDRKKRREEGIMDQIYFAAALIDSRSFFTTPQKVDDIISIENKQDRTQQKPHIEE